MLTGRPTAYDEAWFIGDTHMLAQPRSSLEDLKDEDSFNSKGMTSKTYLLDNYEVVFGSFHHSWAFTTQIRGGLNSLLTAKWKLPNHIFIIFSNDQITESEVLGDELYDVLADTFVFVT